MAKTLTYTGQVTDKLTGKPIAGAAVIVRRIIAVPHDPHEPYERRTIEETKHTTNAAGEYTFTIPPEQVAKSPVNIEAEASHPNYSTRKDVCVPSRIHYREQIGRRPFWGHFDLYPAKQVSGTVVTPDGKPAAGVRVTGFANPDRNYNLNKESHYEPFCDVTTDAQGVFRMNLATGCDAVLWLLPKDFALSTHVLGARRGDMGRLVLQKGR